jgi:hypothetical protein
LMGNAERKNAFGIPTCIWEENIKINLNEMWWDYAHWIQLAGNKDKRRPLLKTVMNIRIKKNGKLLN